MEDMKQRFGECLKKARTEKGLTQTQLAEKCDTPQIHLTQSAISSFEKGLQTPNLEDAVKIAEVLGISLNELCGFDNDSITSYQWLVFLDELVNDPPTIQNKSIISLDSDLKKGVALMLVGDEMTEFFQKYKGLQTIRNIDNDIYKVARKKLFEKYGYLFEVGFKKTVTGMPVYHPPVF